MRCDAQLLWTLVQQHAEPPEHSKGIFAHVATCEDCQATLEDLAGGRRWMGEASQWLDGSENAHPGSPVPPPAPQPVELPFLEPATHPEMLGRIGRYEVEGVLGRGGMGIVLRGFDPELQRAVAIKVLAPEWAASDAARRRFAREAQAAASVAHENVVPIFNVGADATPPYLVMRYIPGTTLEQLVQQEGPLPPDRVLRIASQLAAGLAAAHARRLVHRDVKPANVLVGESVDRVWLTDFGLARAADEARMTRTGVIAGTPHYMSPEQARGESLDHRSDWFSLGCLLYFICTARPPFDALSTLAVLQQTISAKPKPLDQLRPDLPPALVRLVNQLLSKRPERRPSDPESIEDQLQIAGQQLSRGKKSWSPRRRKAVALAPFLVALIVAGFWYWSRPTPPQISPPQISQPTSSPPISATTPGISDPWQAAPGAAGASVEDHRTIIERIELIAGWNTEAFERETRSIDRKIRELEEE